MFSGNANGLEFQQQLLDDATGCQGWECSDASVGQANPQMVAEKHQRDLSRLFGQWNSAWPKNVNAARDLSQLTSLGLVGCALEFVPKEIRCLVHLRQLNLNSNRISWVHADLGQLRELQSLSLGSNCLWTVPPGILVGSDGVSGSGMAQSLQELQLFDNRIQFLPPEIGYLTRLTHLYLGTNQLQCLPPEIGQQSRLQELHLFENRLSTLPTTMGSLRELRLLSLHRNEIWTLPTELGQLTQLTGLYIGLNRLCVIPSELYRISGSLRECCLQENHLHRLPRQIDQLYGLTRLYLWKNDLTFIPSQIGHLPQLRELWLNRNLLAQLPTEIGMLGQLKHLWVNQNHLSSLPTELGRLTQLTHLCLNHNRLRQIPTELGNMKSLVHLQLSQNRLRRLPLELARLHTLERLCVEENRIKVLPLEFITFFSDERRQMMFTLQHNPWYSPSGRLVSLEGPWFSMFQWLSLEQKKMCWFRLCFLTYRGRVTTLSSSRHQTTKKKNLPNGYPPVILCIQKLSWTIQISIIQRLDRVPIVGQRSTTSSPVSYGAQGRA